MTLAEPSRGADEDIEAFWASLIGRIQRGKVIPILGPHLYTAGARAPTFDGAIAQQLRTELGLEDVPKNSTLREVALRALSGPSDRRGTVRDRIRELISAVNHEPASLRQLAEITDFQLFVTTGYDQLLQDALRRARRVPTQTFGYSVDGERGDLPRAGTAEPTVFHLLGSASGQLALTDAELLEHLHCWIEDNHPRRLLTALKENDLLFLGCGFSDWLARFFIRIMSGKRFDRPDLQPRQLVVDEPRRLVVDERVWSDKRQCLFLSHHDFTVIPRITPADFVASLHRRWSSTPRPALPGGNGPMWVDARELVVFLSFCSADRETVRAFKDALTKAGVPAFLDERDIDPGTDWDAVISSNLDHSLLFVPFISKNTERSDDAYFWSEWKDAAARERRKAPDVTFIVPVALDPVDPQAANVPPRFRELQWQQLHGRAPTDTFVQFIRETYREGQRRRRRR